MPLVDGTQYEELIGSRAHRLGLRERLRPMSGLDAASEAFGACQLSAGPLFRASAGPGLALVATALFLAKVVVPQATLVRGAGAPAFAPLLAVLAAFAVALPLAAWALGSVLDAAVEPAASHFTGTPVTAKRSAVPASMVSTFLLALPLASGLGLLFLADALEAAGTGPGARTAFMGLGWMSLGIAPFWFLVLCEPLGVAPVASAVEGVGAWASLLRGFRLANRRVRFYGVGSSIRTMVLVLCLVGPLVYGSTALVAGLIPQEAVRSIVRPPLLAELATSLLGVLPLVACAAFAIPLWCTAAVTGYYSRRVCVEGFDIETLAAEVGIARDES